MSEVSTQLEQIVASGTLQNCKLNLRGSMSEQKPRSFNGLEARKLLRRARTAALATLNRDGEGPYVSVVNIATDVNGWPIILISRLAWHTRNLLINQKASILVSELPDSGDALTGPRVTIMGRFVPASGEAMKRRYLARHPAAQGYAGFSDFSFWRLEPQKIHAVAGFGRIETMAPDEVFLDSPDISAIEMSAIAHLNEEHSDAVRRYATQLLGAPDGPWAVASVDGDGAVLVLGEESLVLQFETPVNSAQELRKAFVELSKKVI
jgi:heme iron utilization protein